VSGKRNIEAETCLRSRLQLSGSGQQKNKSVKFKSSSDS
jgi:hypothetical protein